MDNLQFFGIFDGDKVNVAAIDLFLSNLFDFLEVATCKFAFNIAGQMNMLLARVHLLTYPAPEVKELIIPSTIKI